jgi:hypothetical protein
VDVRLCAMRPCVSHTWYTWRRDALRMSGRVEGQRSAVAICHAESRGNARQLESRNESLEKLGCVKYGGEKGVGRPYLCAGLEMMA